MESKGGTEAESTEEDQEAELSYGYAFRQGGLKQNYLKIKFNPFIPSRQFCHCKLDKSICHFRGISFYFY